MAGLCPHPTRPFRAQRPYVPSRFQSSVRRCNAMLARCRKRHVACTEPPQLLQDAFQGRRRAESRGIQSAELLRVEDGPLSGGTNASSMSRLDGSGQACPKSLLRCSVSLGRKLVKACPSRDADSIHSDEFELINLTLKEDKESPSWSTSLTSTTCTSQAMIQSHLCLQKRPLPPPAGSCYLREPTQRTSDLPGERNREGTRASLAPSLRHVLCK